MAVYDSTTRHILNSNLLTQDPEFAVRGERALWRAVIAQALMDASSTSAKPEAQFDRFEALRWLSGAGKDFNTVCDFAGLNPEYVRRMAKRALTGGCKWRADAGSSRRYQPSRAKQSRTSPTPAEDAPRAQILPFPTIA